MTDSGNTRPSGPTNIYNIPAEAYKQYAERDKQLAEMQQMMGAASIAQGAAQLLQTTVQPSDLDRLWGTDTKTQNVRVAPPPGYGSQFVTRNGEFVFGAPSHLSSLEATVGNIAEAPLEQRSTIVDLLRAVSLDMQTKNQIQARKGSLQQG